MKVLEFKCTLLSDVILNRNIASTGPNETLDFIPGSNFLGIAASRLYPRVAEGTEPDPETVKALEEASVIFHSGKVRFGDAHPSLAGFRGLKVPAAMFYPKLSSPDRELYISYHTPDTPEMKKRQLKQCRSGFYDFSATESGAGRAMPVKTETDFAIKSAYDRNLRRAKDEQLFGYQSLRRGLTTYFTVEIDDSDMEPGQADAIARKIRHALSGEKRIGRSRSAQYGLVKIEEEPFRQVAGGAGLSTEERDMTAVYADGRLIFLDDEGQPTFRPTAEQLGLSGEVLWDKSQIRTFRYAPWNFKRQSFDTDRCGLEKGSVIIVRTPGAASSSPAPRYVGAYINEGFGRVIYNPAFLKAGSDGGALCRLESRFEEKEDTRQPKKGVSGSLVNSPFINFLRESKANDSSEIWDKVNAWINENASRFTRKASPDERFASQWGTIRSLAMGAKDADALKSALFDEGTGYLKHGVAADKWKERDRLNKFKEFVEEQDSATVRHAVINLAAEMAKKCKN